MRASDLRARALCARSCPRVYRRGASNKPRALSCALPVPRARGQRAGRRAVLGRARCGVVRMSAHCRSLVRAGSPCARALASSGALARCGARRCAAAGHGRWCSRRRWERRLQPTAATTAASLAVLRRRPVSTGTRHARPLAAALSRCPSPRAARRGRRGWALLPVRRPAPRSAPVAAGCGSDAGSGTSALGGHEGARCAPSEPCSAQHVLAVIVVVTALQVLWPLTVFERHGPDAPGARWSRPNCRLLQLLPSSLEVHCRGCITGAAVDRQSVYW